MSGTDEEAYRRAKKKVRNLRHFYKHLLTFSVVIVFLHILNLMTSSYYWAIWPTLGWGVGISLHGIQLFDFSPFFGAEWEERKIKQIMERRAGKS
ncbi:MAG: 2TM domain-containing protein [Sneathiella sp.]|nr:2TM domain-containing protein [Sneathiella sp.]